MDSYVPQSDLLDDFFTPGNQPQPSEIFADAPELLQLAQSGILTEITVCHYVRIYVYVSKYGIFKCVLGAHCAHVQLIVSGSQRERALPKSGAGEQRSKRPAVSSRGASRRCDTANEEKGGTRECGAAAVAAAMAVTPP